jgi:hypothetical protein
MFGPEDPLGDGPQLLATSLHVDPAAELHEEASARLREQSRSPRLLDLAPVTQQPPRRAGM